MISLTAWNILQEGVWGPTLHKYCLDHARKCDSCQMFEKPLWKNEMSLSLVNSNAFEI
jgi:hypothetical protein